MLCAGRWLVDRMVVSVFGTVLITTGCLTIGKVTELHNSFILAAVHNARKSIGPPIEPSEQSWFERSNEKDGSTYGDGDRSPSKRLKHEILSMRRSERDRIKSLAEVRT